MKKIVSILIILSIATFLFAEPDFRKVNWGMSKAEIIQSENGTPLMEDDSMVVYTVKVGGLNATLYYSFIYNKLVNSGYIFNEDHTNRNGFIEDFNKLNTLLNKKYGPPGVDKEKWLNDLYKDDSSEWGFAVSLGHLIYYTEWDNEKTIISHALTGENYKISHSLMYSSVEFKDLTDKAKEESESEGL